MRIYAVADLHGKPERLSIVRREAAEIRPDVVAVAGDYAGRDPVRAFEDLAGMECPVLIVQGNMDGAVREEDLAPYSRLRLLHLQRVCAGGFPFVGVSGTLPLPFDSRFRLRGKSLMADLESLLDVRDILLVHPPPYGVLDEGFGGLHAGCRNLRDAVLRKTPRLCICGHIHERPGAALLGGTLVVNCSMGHKGAGAVIRLDESGPPQVEMRRE